MPGDKIAVVVLTIAVVACDRSPLPTVPGSSASLSAAPAHSRRDTPWARLSDDELTARVADAKGLVFIGFKDASAKAGVSESGKVLASAAAKVTARGVLARAGAVIEFVPMETPYVVARIPLAAISGLRHNPWIEYIEPSSTFSVSSQDTTWNVRKIGAVDSWAHSNGSGVIVQVIDTGIRTSAELDPAVVHSCVEGDGNDARGHGTQVSGIIAAADNSAGIVGAAPGVTLWSSKVSDNENTIQAAAIACAVNFGRLFGARVMNISLNSDTSNTALTDEINAAYSTNSVVIVASAGNNDGGPVRYPATLESVIAVSAVDQGNSYANFSAQGSKIELTAPGTTEAWVTGITTICLDGTPCSSVTGEVVQGTSIAAPHVAAAAALLLSYNPTWSSYEVRRRLNAGAIPLGAPGRDVLYGNGLVSVAGALMAAPFSGAGIPPHYLLILHGPTSAQPGNNCYWYASTSIVNPTYEWSVDGQVLGGSTLEFWHTADTSFELQVRAWNEEGAYQITTTTVNVSSENSRCFVE